MVYVVSRMGVTGHETQWGEKFENYIAGIRKYTDLPLAVGFGIASPTQVHAVANVADGVVVGSALVEALGRGGVGALEALLADLGPACIRTVTAGVPVV